MRVVVELLTSELATVVIYPSWWRWLLLGERTREFFSERVHSINGGWVWLDDATGRPVEPHIQRAIECEVALIVSRGTHVAR